MGASVDIAMLEVAHCEVSGPPSVEGLSGVVALGRN